MRKLLFITLLFVTVICKAQVGLMLTGQTFTNVNDSITISTLYVIPSICFNGVNGGYITLTPCRSKYQAVQLSPLYITSWGGLNIWQLPFNSPTNITKATAVGLATTYLQEQGFTVTTF